MKTKYDLCVTFGETPNADWNEWPVGVKNRVQNHINALVVKLPLGTLYKVSSFCTSKTLNGRVMYLGYVTVEAELEG